MKVWDVPQYEEKLQEALNRQEEIRVNSLFWGDYTQPELLGVELEPFNILHLLILDETRNGLITGQYGLGDAMAFLYMVNKRKWVPRWYLNLKILIYSVKHKGEGETVSDYIMGKVWEYVDNETIDLPSKYSERVSQPTDYPRINYGLELIYEVMKGANMGYGEVTKMPLSRFFQFIKLIRRDENPEYLGNNLTDLVRNWGMKELNRLKREKNG